MYNIKIKIIRLKNFNHLFQFQFYLFQINSINISNNLYQLKYPFSYFLYEQFKNNYIYENKILRINIEENMINNIYFNNLKGRQKILKNYLKNY